MVVTILSKTGRKPTVGGKCFKELSKWLFTGLPTEFQAASVRLLGCFPCPKGRVPKAVLDKSDFGEEFYEELLQLGEVLLAELLNVNVPRGGFVADFMLKHVIRPIWKRRTTPGLCPIETDR